MVATGGDKWSELGVPRVIIKALQEQNFHSPTTIQALSIPPAIAGQQDILGAAETGSGKTLAFGIPILNGILQMKKQQGNIILTSSGKFNEISDDEISNDENSNNAVRNSVISNKETSNNEISRYNNNKKFKTKENVELFDNNGVGLVKVINNVKFNYETTPTSDQHLLKPLYALILTPTRELAYQIQSHLLKAAKFIDVQIATVVGGLAPMKQERILSKGPEIVIATPGRLWELISEGNPHLSQIDSIRYLVIDETDRMLEKYHFLELHQIIERINSKEEEALQRQIFVFSATLTLVHDIPNYLQKKRTKTNRKKILKLTPAQKLQNIIEILRLKHPKVIDVTKATGTATSLTECRIVCTMDHKDYYLYYFLQRHPGRTLIFCNSIGCVKRLTTLFGILNCNPLPLHANMLQRQRLKNLERFQNETCALLVATDVAARGLDIPRIDHVIHYQVPRTSESYVHRSGRTARAESEGITVLMMAPFEKHYYSRLCKTLNRTEDLPIFPVIDSLLVAVKERVNIAREIDKFELQCRRENSQKGWLQKAANDLDVLLDDDEITDAEDTDKMVHLKRLLKAKKHYLASLMKKPLFPKGLSMKFDAYALEDLNSPKAIDLMKTVNESSKSKKKSPYKGCRILHKKFKSA